MKLYIIINDTASDCERELSVLGTFFSKETAQKQFDELRGWARKKYTDKWTIGNDTDSRIEAYKPGYAARDHDYITLHEVKTACDRDSPFSSLDEPYLALLALKKEIENESVSTIRNKLLSLKASKLDFSLLTDNSGGEGRLPEWEAEENRIGIDQWDRHNSWYTIYPTEVRIDKESGGLIFRCTEHDGIKHELWASEIPAEELYRIARMLLYHFDHPKSGAKAIVKNHTARFVLR